MLKIQVDHLREEPEVLDINVPVEELDLDVEGYQFRGRVLGQVEFSLVGRDVRGVGKMQARVVAPCIRCLEPVEAGLKRIAREQIETAIRNLGDESLPEAAKIHGWRARCKKMRGLLRLAGPVMGAGFPAEDRRFRDAGRRLGALRDAQVLTDTLSLLGVDEQPAVAPPAAIDARLTGRVSDDMHEALAAVDAWQLNVGGFHDLVPGLAGTYAAGRRAWRRAAGEPTDRRFHKLRKWAKYLWYQTRILERMNKSELRRRRTRLRIVHESLGQAHDLAVLRERLAPGADSNGDLSARADERREKLYALALRRVEQVYADPVGRYVADMTAWWADWRPDAD